MKDNNIEVIAYDKVDSFILSEEQLLEKDKFEKFSHRYWLIFSIICLAFIVVSITITQLIYRNELMKTPIGAIVRLSEALNENDFDKASRQFIYANDTEKAQIEQFWANYYEDLNDIVIDYVCDYYTTKKIEGLADNEYLPNLYHETYSNYHSSAYIKSSQFSFEVEQINQINDHCQMIECSFHLSSRVKVEGEREYGSGRIKKAEIYLVKDNNLNRWFIYSNLHDDGSKLVTDIPNF